MRRRLVSLGLLALTASPVQAGALSAADLEAAASLLHAAPGGGIGTAERDIRADIVRFETLDELRAARSRRPAGPTPFH